MHHALPKVIVMNPLRNFRFSITDDGQSPLIARLKQFAATNHFTFHSSQVCPDPRCIAVEMERDDFSITITNPFNPEDFRVSFNKLSPSAPPVATASLDAVEQSLKSFVPDLKNEPVEN